MRKPDWQRDGVRLYCGDCLEIMAEMAPDSVDAVVTDPPYGIGGKWVGGSGHGWGNADSEKPKRNAWDSLPASEEQIDMLLSIGTQHVIWGGNYFHLPPSRCWFVWNKPERNFTLAECELAWTDFDNVARVYDCHRRDTASLHPTQKPIALLTWCVDKTKGSILDPFMGSGTTGVAAVNLDREFIGIEIDRGYFDIAVRRISAAMDQGKLF